MRQSARYSIGELDPRTLSLSVLCQRCCRGLCSTKQNRGVYLLQWSSLDSSFWDYPSWYCSWFFFQKGLGSQKRIGLLMSLESFGESFLQEVDQE